MWINDDTHILLSSPWGLLTRQDDACCVQHRAHCFRLQILALITEHEREESPSFQDFWLAQTHRWSVLPPGAEHCKDPAQPCTCSWAPWCCGSFWGL